MWIDGYNERLIEQHEIARRLAYFSLSQHYKFIPQQQFNQDYWPLPADVEERKAKIQRLKEKQRRLSGGRINENRDSGASPASNSGS